MAAKFRNLIAAQSLNTMRSLNPEVDLERARQVARNLRLCKTNARISLRVGQNCIPHFSRSNMSNFIKEFQEDSRITGIAADKEDLHFYVDQKQFIQQVLQTTSARPKRYKWNRNALFEEETKKVVVEFSSPNIAKPFHIGHFRSTIVGNFVANIHKAVGHDVHKINYLGDWGTQFGYLMAGIKHFNVNLDSLKDEPLNKLLDIYIKANKLAESNPDFHKEAMDQFRRLEEGDTELIKVWTHFREMSIHQLKEIYSRLNIDFDEYQGESQYSGDASIKVLDALHQSNLLQDFKGRKVIQLNEDKNVTIIKSDGSSLYITRDIGAAIDRREKLSFDKLIYVVDNSQATHFANLFKILDLMGHSWSPDCQHCRFGKILGMSTRKGSMLFLDSIIEEATARMQENQAKSKTTRVAGEEAQNAASVLGISALIINDFKHRRVKDYKFSWENALAPNGDTGVRLQYLHARLNSLLLGSEVDALEDSNTDHLVEQEALDLVYHIGLWDEALHASYESLEPALIVKYLFSLVNHTNRCLKLLNVKGADADTARARLLLFAAAQKVLAEGLRILGVQPLDRM